MAITFITAGILVLSALFAVIMLYKLWQQPAEPLSFLLYVKLIATGILAFISDTLGIGSFAVNTALSKLMGTFHDDELPAVNNGAQVIPGVIESLFFMHLVDVDLTTLLTLVAGTCLGGFIGGFIVSSLNKQTIRLAMICSFTLVIFLLIGHQFNILPVGGDLMALHSWKLVIGFVALTLCGVLTSAGVGLFVMVQGLLFVLNVSPLVAFPIMTTAGAMQQPLTSLVFLYKNKIPLKRTFIISLAGCVGVLITLPVFAHLTITWLHSLLLCILIYNLLAIGRAYLRARPEKGIQARTNYAIAE